MKIYNAVIYKTYILLYGIKLSTKLPQVFCYRQSRICGNNIGKAKYLLFSQVETLLLRALKKQLYIFVKLVKSRNVIIISIIMH